MMRFTKLSKLAAGLLAGLLAASGVAVAQTPSSGQFGQRAGNSYVPSTHDANCQGLLCSPLPSMNSANPAAGPADVAPPPPCQGLLCGLTPYSMQRPYTAAEAAEVERQRAAAQAQAAAAPPPEAATPVRHARKRRKIAKTAAAGASMAKTATARTATAKTSTARTVTAKSAVAPATAVPAKAPQATARTPAPSDDVQTLR